MIAIAFSASPSTSKAKRLEPLKPSEATSMSTATPSGAGLGAGDLEAGVRADQLAVAPRAHLVVPGEAAAVVVDPPLRGELRQERLRVLGVDGGDGARDGRREDPGSFRGAYGAARRLPAQRGQRGRRAPRPAGRPRRPRAPRGCCGG